MVELPIPISESKMPQDEVFWRSVFPARGGKNDHLMKGRGCRQLTEQVNEVAPIHALPDLLLRERDTAGVEPLEQVIANLEIALVVEHNHPKWPIKKGGL